MNIVLKNQVEASEKSANEIGEQLMLDSECAILAFDVRDLAKSVVGLFHDLNKDVHDWQSRRSPTERPNQRETNFGTVWHDLYVRLAGVFEKTSKLIQVVERI